MAKVSKKRKLPNYVKTDEIKVTSLISSVIIILYLMSSCKINKYKFIWSMS